MSSLPDRVAELEAEVEALKERVSEDEHRLMLCIWLLREVVNGHVLAGTENGMFVSPESVQQAHERGMCADWQHIRDTMMELNDLLKEGDTE